MTPLPSNPIALKDHVFSAVCSDLLDGGNRVEIIRAIHGADPALALRAKPYGLGASRIDPGERKESK